MAWLILNIIRIAFVTWLLQSTPLVFSCTYTNQIFTSTLALQSDNCVIDSCLFINIIGNALIIQDNRDNLTIINSQFTNISGNGIIFSADNQLKNILVENNTFEALNQSAIFSESTLIIELIIKHNNISNIPGFAIQLNSYTRNILIAENKIYQVHHGIYIQGSNYTISHNKIYQITLEDAITVGAFGNINGNILYDISNHAIKYINTETTSNQTFLIENNMIYSVNKAAIYMDSKKHKFDNLIIRFNTIIVNTNHTLIKTTNSSNSSAIIYGNILLNADRNLKISNDDTLKMSLTCNLISKPDEIGHIRFKMYDETIDPEIIDLHISPHSWLTYGYCNGYNFSLPMYDIDDDIRGENNRIDVGADRILEKQLNIQNELKSWQYLFITIVFAVLIICIVFVLISGYRKHKTMQETYKNATTFVRPRTDKQTNKVMKMMLGGKVAGSGNHNDDNSNDDNSNDESLEFDTSEDEKNAHMRSNYQIPVDKGKISALRIKRWPDETGINITTTPINITTTPMNIDDEKNPETVDINISLFSSIHVDDNDPEILSGNEDVMTMESIGNTNLNTATEMVYNSEEILTIESFEKTPTTTEIVYKNDESLTEEP